LTHNCDIRTESEGGDRGRRTPERRPKKNGFCWPKDRALKSRMGSKKCFYFKRTATSRSRVIKTEILEWGSLAKHRDQERKKLLPLISVLPSRGGLKGRGEKKIRAGVVPKPIPREGKRPLKKTGKSRSRGEGSCKGDHVYGKKCNRRIQVTSLEKNRRGEAHNGKRGKFRSNPTRADHKGGDAEGRYPTAQPSTTETFSRGETDKKHFGG